MTNRTITDPSGNKFTISIPDGQNPSEADIFEFAQQEISAGRLKPDAPEPGFFSAENWTPEGSASDITKPLRVVLKMRCRLGLWTKCRMLEKLQGSILATK